MLRRLVLYGFLAFTVFYVALPTATYAISLDDDEEDAEDVADLLEQAKKAGANESFDTATILLKKAKMYGVSLNDTQEVINYVAQKKRARDERLEREQKEKERLARLKAEREDRERQTRIARQSTQNSSFYITNWGYAFNTDDSIWGRNGIKLSNGSTIYTWLQKKTYGMKCYELFVQGAFLGSASNCSDSIHNSWKASACGSSFWVTGDQTDVVKAIVGRCGN